MPFFPLTHTRLQYAGVMEFSGKHSAPVDFTTDGSAFLPCLDTHTFCSTLPSENEIPFLPSVTATLHPLHIIQAFTMAVRRPSPQDKQETADTESVSDAHMMLIDRCLHRVSHTVRVSAYPSCRALLHSYRGCCMIRNAHDLFLFSLSLSLLLFFYWQHWTHTVL